MQIGNFQTLSSLLYLHYYNRRILVACCQQGKHRLLRRCYVPKPGILHITRGTFPPGAHSGIEGLYYTILGNFNPAVSRMVFKCYGGLIIAALRSQSRCFSVLPDMPANTGAGSRLKNQYITLWRTWYKREYGGAVNGVKGVAYALGPSFSVASCGVGSVDAVTLYAISPPR